MLQHRVEDLSAAELDREREVVGGLTDAVRELVDAVIRTRADDDELRAVRAEVSALVERLRADQLPGPFGISVTPDGAVRNHGNAVVGLRNAIAPPLDVQQDPSGRAWADCVLGAAYEGPPGLVHGGVSALVLDQICGEAAAAGGTPGMTGTLEMRYRRGTPLGPLRVEAEITRNEGIKTWVEGRISDAEGPTVECTGLFILPRWAREEPDRERPTRFE